MKYAYLVALREYIESTKAKGFWIGILIMPVIIFLSIQAPVFLEEKATPIRYWVLVDQSGTFAPDWSTNTQYRMGVAFSSRKTGAWMERKIITGMMRMPIQKPLALVLSMYSRKATR